MSSSHGIKPIAGLDKFDYQILDILQRNGRAKAQEIAAAIGLSETPVRNRIRRLENEGFITGYRATLNWHQLGLKMLLSILVKMPDHRATTVQEFIQVLGKEFPYLQMWVRLTGNWDFMLLFLVTGMDHASEISGKLTMMEKYVHLIRAHVPYEMGTLGMIPLPKTEFVRTE